MRKLLILLAFVLMTCSSVWAATASFGVGFSAGLDIPLIQQDQGSGSVFGFKGRFKPIKMIALEPNLNFTKFGAPVISGLNTTGLEGSKITAFGVDATLGGGMGGSGFKPYLLFGAGSFKTKNEVTKADVSTFGWTMGLGFELGVSPTIGLGVRSKLVILPQEDGGSKKSAAITGGFSYYFGGKGDETK